MPMANRSPNIAENLAVNSKVLLSCVPFRVKSILTSLTANGKEIKGSRINHSLPYMKRVISPF